MNITSFSKDCTLELFVQRDESGTLINVSIRRL